MKTTWALVADEAIARILRRPPEGGDLVPVEELTDPDAHAKEGEMRNGPHGRRASPGGSGTQATVSALFAKRIAQRLLELQREHRFTELHLFAAPRLLGYLREALHQEVTGVVVSSTDKNLVQESNAELTRRVFGAERPAR
jgi:protein required for attachment to host cells